MITVTNLEIFFDPLDGEDGNILLRKLDLGVDFLTFRKLMVSVPLRKKLDLTTKVQKVIFLARFSFITSFP